MELEDQRMTQAPEARVHGGATSGWMELEDQWTTQAIEEWSEWVWL
jgi:hypothetical protein